MFCSTLAESKNILKKESVLQILLGYSIEKIYSDKYISNNIECNNIILIIIYNY